MSERVNLASTHPDIVKTLQHKFAEIDGNIKPAKLNR